MPTDPRLLMFLLVAVGWTRASGEGPPDSAAAGSTTTSKEVTAASEADRSKSKRQYALGDVFLHSDVELLHAGALLAEHQPYAGLPGYFQPEEPQALAFQQPLAFFVQDHTSGIHHQGTLQAETKHPTKPVYHYTPLPKGTFPAPKPHEVKDERNPSEEARNHENHHSSHASYVSNPTYLFGYRVNDAQQSLEMGRKEKLEGNFLQGMYHVLLPDNRLQIVQYWSDLTGYHPSITYA